MTDTTTMSGTILSDFFEATPHLVFSSFTIRFNIFKGEDENQKCLVGFRLTRPKPEAARRRSELVSVVLRVFQDIASKSNDPEPNADMPLTMPDCSASAFELVCYFTVRGVTFYRKVGLFACLSVVNLCVVLLPLFMTQTISYGAARKVCHDYTFMWINETKFDVDSRSYDPEWDMDDFATWDLFPIHLFNSISTVVSLFGFGVWLFFSPHKFNEARDLDRTCTIPDVSSQIIQTHYYPLSSCAHVSLSFFLLHSRQLFCPSVAGEPSCCCDSVGRKLCAIRFRAVVNQLRGCCQN
jgi:hypothetical protein